MIIAQKPCSFGGVDYYAGDRVPDEDVIDASSLEKMGVVAVIADDKEDHVRIRVPVKKGSASIPIMVTNDQLVKAVEIIQMNQKDAIAKIKESDDDTVLILVSALDYRTAVKKELEAKSTATESAGD